MKRVKRGRDAKPANRPWTLDECRTVIANIPEQLRLPVALGMFTGLRKGDVLTLTKAAIRDGKIWRRTNKTGQEISIPIHPDLAHLLATAPRHDAITIAAATKGAPWTESGFNSSFIKAPAALKREEKVGDGLTFHGLSTQSELCSSKLDMTSTRYADGLVRKRWQWRSTTPRQLTLQIA